MRLALRILFVDFFAFTAEAIQRIQHEFITGFGRPELYFLTNMTFI